MKCPKCGGEMEEGVSVDQGINNTPYVQVWAKRIEGFLKHTVGQKSIIVYRCQKCGYLESYAK